MKRISILLTLAITIVVSGCIFPLRTTSVIGSGNLITESRRVSNFTSIDLSGVGTLVVQQGNKETLEITAEDNLLEYIESNVVGKRLELGVRDFVNLQPKKEITYKLTVKDLDKVETSGLGKLEMGSFETAKFSFEVSGSGDADFENINANSITIEISGLGNIHIKGTTGTQRVVLSGAGYYDGTDLVSDSATVKISGTGKAIVWAKDALNVDLSGAGNVQYYGSPILNTEISGVGSLESLGEK